MRRLTRQRWDHAIWGHDRWPEVLVIERWNQYSAGIVRHRARAHGHDLRCGNLPADFHGLSGVFWRRLRRALFRRDLRRRYGGGHPDRQQHGGHDPHERLCARHVRTQRFSDSEWGVPPHTPPSDWGLQRGVAITPSERGVPLHTPSQCGVGITPGKSGIPTRTTPRVSERSEAHLSPPGVGGRSGTLPVVPSRARSIQAFLIPSCDALSTRACQVFCACA